MQIINCISGESVSSLPDGAILLLGYFDGVHLGHKSLVRTAAELSSGKIPVVAWMFERLPKGEILTDNAEKCALLGKCGANYAVFEDFDSLKDMDGRSFFDDVLIRKYHPSAVVCGYNFRFGRRAAWSSIDLSRFADEAGIGCTVVPAFEMSGNSVSSTAIRNHITAGRTDEAAALLGRLYSVTLPVLHGKMIGRTIGQPTVNQQIPAGRISPSHGVYSCLVSFTDEDGVYRTCGGVCNIGSRPTVNSDTTDVTLETHILDYSGNLYGVDVKTSFWKKLRGEKRFSSLDELSAQIERDGIDARKSLSELEKYDFAR